MRTLQRVLLVGAGASLVLGGVAVWTAARDDGQRPASAEEVADGDGPRDLGKAWVGQVDLEEVTLDDFAMGTATLVRPGDDGTVNILVESQLETYVVRSTAVGDVDRVGMVLVDARTTAFDVDADGTYGWLNRTFGGELSLFIGEPEWVMADQGTYLDAPFEADALDVVDDESVIVASGDGPRIDVISADEGARRLLGPADDPDARVTTDESFGRIVALTQLDDGRITFVAGTDDGDRLYLLDDTAVRPVPVDAASSNSVRSPDAPPADDPSRRDRLAMTPLAPGPDGRVLTVGLNDDDEPEVNLVDVDNGDAELLAILDRVEPTIDEPVSAAFAGNDLVFTAQGSIWRLADAR